MRVLSVLESVSRVDGGIFEAELALQRELARMDGMAVDVVALRDEFTDADAERWTPIRSKVAEVRGPAGFGFAPGLTDLMCDSADVGYCAALWKYPAWSFLNWQKRTGRPVVVAPHGSLDSWALRNSRWKKRIAAWIFKDEQLCRATCLRALCDAEVDSIRAYGLRQRVEVVPNGVVLPAVLAGERRSKIGDRVGRRRLVFLGRIHPKKGLVGLIRAWAKFKCEKGNAKWGDWELAIAGWDQGGHENELKALCAELGLKVFSFQGSVSRGEGADVVFRGPVFGREKEELLRGAEAFVLPSFSEGLPMSVLEAWSYGLPVVMTPECNLPEGFANQAALEIRNRELATSHAQPATPTKLVSDWDGLRTLLEMTDSERREMGMRGRRLVEERFTWSKVAARMKEIFESLL